MEKKRLEAKYGLPEEVVFCKRCVYSNQRPSSTVELKSSNNDQLKTTLLFDDEGVCNACRWAEMKDNEIDWEEKNTSLESYVITIGVELVIMIVSFLEWRKRQYICGPYFKIQV